MMLKAKYGNHQHIEIIYRANWEGLSQGLSNYYNSPGRLALFRRRFESETRRAGADPATFATEFWRPGDLERVHTPETGWSGTDLLRTNRVVDCGAT